MSDINNGAASLILIAVALSGFILVSGSTSTNQTIETPYYETLTYGENKVLPASINTLAIIYGDTWSTAHCSSVAANFDFVITDFPNTAGNPTAIKTYDPTVKIIGYKDLAFSHIGYPDWTTINDGSHEDWFIHDNAGNRVASTVYSDVYLMDPSNAGWRAHWASYVNALFALYPTFDGVLADDSWTELDYIADWSQLKDAVTSAVLTDASFPAGVVSGWHSNVAGMLASIKASIGTKLLIPNTDEGYFGGTTYLDVVDGALTEGYIHAPSEAVASHTYMTFGTYENSLAYLQYGVANSKVMLCESGCTTNDEATVQFSYAGFLLGFGSTAYWGWNTGTTYEYANRNNVQSIMALDIDAPSAVAYIAQDVYMRDFTGGKVLFNNDPVNTFNVVVGAGYKTLAGVTVANVNVAPYTTVLLYTVADPITTWDLTVNSAPVTGIEISYAAGNTFFSNTNFTANLSEDTYTVTAPATCELAGINYEFVEWEDASTNPVRNIVLTANTAITATYVLVEYIPIMTTPTLNVVLVDTLIVDTPVTVSITISGSGAAPTGTATFYVSNDSGVTWLPIGLAKTLVAGSATSIAYYPGLPGNYLFAVDYSGDANYYAATSTVKSLTVQFEPVMLGLLGAVLTQTAKQDYGDNYWDPGIWENGMWEHDTPMQKIRKQMENQI